MKLYENGVYLINGRDLVEDGKDAAEAVKNKTGNFVTKEEAAKIPLPTAFYPPTIPPAIWKNFRLNSIN